MAYAPWAVNKELSSFDAGDQKGLERFAGILEKAMKGL